MAQTDLAKKLLWRFVRSALTTSIAAWWARKQQDPRFIALAPVLMTAGKLIREKAPALGPFIPF